VRLTVLLVALAFLVLAAEPSAVMAGAQEYSSAYSQDYPPVSDGYSASEAYQSGSEEYQSVSQEYPEISREHAAPQEYPSISREYQPETEEYPMISREYQ
jgi:hypothetical protein